MQAFFRLMFLGGQDNQEAVYSPGVIPDVLRVQEQLPPELIGLEEMHEDEINKMMRKPGEIGVYTPWFQ